MSYKVDTIGPFHKAAKKLIKKYPSLKNELAEPGRRLASDPTAGTALGNNCYKIRLAIASKGRGKSGGQELLPMHNSQMMSPEGFPEQPAGFRPMNLSKSSKLLERYYELLIDITAIAYANHEHQ